MARFAPGHGRMSRTVNWPLRRLVRQPGDVPSYAWKITNRRVAPVWIPPHDELVILITGTLRTDRLPNPKESAFAAFDSPDVVKTALIDRGVGAGIGFHCGGIKLVGRHDIDRFVQLAEDQYGFRAL